MNALSSADENACAMVLLTVNARFNQIDQGNERLRPHLGLPFLVGHFDNVNVFQSKRGPRLGPQVL